MHSFYKRNKILKVLKKFALLVYKANFLIGDILSFKNIDIKNKAR